MFVFTKVIFVDTHKKKTQKIIIFYNSPNIHRCLLVLSVLLMFQLHVNTMVLNM